MIEFNVGDTVHIGPKRQKGKIVDIVYPVGPQSCIMYKVQLFNEGTIRTVDKVTLVKGLQNDILLPDQTVMLPPTCTTTSTLLSQIFETKHTYFDEQAFIETDPDDQIAELLGSVDVTANPSVHSAYMFVDEHPPQIQDLGSQHSSKQNSRFAKPVQIEDYIFENENKATRRKTLSHQKLFESYLEEQNELRAICDIAPADLNNYSSQFLVSVRQQNGDEYEPVTLRSIVGSLERYLKRHSYGCSLISGNEFSKSREVLKCKQKDLKRQGRGNKPNAADAISDEQINILYESGQLGPNTPTSMLNTLWFNNCLYFGMRGGGAEHRQLRWGDLNLCYDSDLNQEYIDFNERQTKTRTGEDVSNTCKDKPRMYARPDSERCPVMLYKKYADKRPELMSQNDSPFYLATITNKSMLTENERWFLSQPIGVNKLNGLLKTMALRAHLPDLPYMRITNTSVRKHLCQKLLDCNIPDTHAIHITGHKNPQSLNNYRKLSNKQKQHVSTLLSSSNEQNENQEFRKPQFLPNIPSNPISEPHVHVPEVQRLIPSTPISEPHVHVPEVQRLIPSTPISEPHVHVPEVQRLIPSTSNPISEPHVHVPEVQRLIPSTPISEPHVHVPEVQRHTKKTRFQSTQLKQLKTQPATKVCNFLKQHHH